VLAWLAGLWSLGRTCAALVGAGRLSRFAARTLFHVLDGASVLPLAWWVEPWYLAAVPAAVMLAGNAGGNRSRWTAKQARDRTAFLLGGVIVPFLLFVFLWARGQQSLVALAVLMMSVGDAAAAVAGTAWSRHHGRPPGRKTLAGFAANLVSSAVVIVAAGAVFGIPLRPLLSAAVAAAGAGALLEYLLPGRWDNPVVLTAALLLLAGLLGRG
jgi:CDP-diglyceride synthetase